jgi:CspA family cold shock protein
MKYKDQWAETEDGNKILFTVEMQRRLDEAGLPIEFAAVAQLPDVPDSRPARAASSHTSSYKESAPKKEETDFAEPTTIQIDPVTGKYIGRMKWYNAKKGYGFLVRGGGEEIFFHKSGTVGEPTEIDEGQWILYDVEETKKGPEATEIEPYEGNTDQLT